MHLIGNVLFVTGTPDDRALSEILETADILDLSEMELFKKLRKLEDELVRLMDMGKPETAEVGGEVVIRIKGNDLSMELDLSDEDRSIWGMVIHRTLRRLARSLNRYLEITEEKGPGSTLSVEKGEYPSEFIDAIPDLVDLLDKLWYEIED